ALKRRGSLTIWFDPEMTWEAKPTDKRGRQPTCSDAAVQTCLTMKVLLGMVDIGAPLVRAKMSTRQMAGFVESLLQLAGLDWSVPDFS
ncbi:transposase, partial [Rhodovulum sulfidophilum]